MDPVTLTYDHEKSLSIFLFKFHFTQKCSFKIKEGKRPLEMIQKDKSIIIKTLMVPYKA